MGLREGDQIFFPYPIYVSYGIIELDDFKEMENSIL